MSIKVTAATFRNFGQFDEYSCSFDENITYICGPNGMGKTMIGYRGLWACVKGIAESCKNGQMPGKRYIMISDKGKSSDIGYIFRDTETKAEFSISNHITKQGNDISINQINNIPVSPDTLDDFLNVSLMSAKNFCGMSPKDQALALGIDTSEYNKKIKELKDEYTLINRDIKNVVLPETPPEQYPVEDIDELKKNRNTVSNSLNEVYKLNRDYNRKAMEDYNEACRERQVNISEMRKKKEGAFDILNSCENAANTLYSAGLKEYLCDECDNVHCFIDDLKIKYDSFSDDLPEVEKPELVEEMPDRTELDNIDKRIEQTYENTAKNKEYEDYISKADVLIRLKSELSANKAWQKKAEKDKLEYVKSHNFNFSGLEINEDGELTLKGKYINETYFSRGEIEKIVAMLHASLNPKFKCRFLDDFDLVDQDNQKAIIGYLVENGFQIIIATVGDHSGKNKIVLRKKVDDNKEKLI